MEKSCKNAKKYVKSLTGDFFFFYYLKRRKRYFSIDLKINIENKLIKYYFLFTFKTKTMAYGTEVQIEMVVMFLLAAFFLSFSS